MMDWKWVVLVAGLATVAAEGSACAADLSSQLTAVTIRSTAPAEAPGYVRLTGTVHGVVDPHEAVVGAGALPTNGAGLYEYDSDFEIVAPAGGRAPDGVVYVDSENRGGPISWRALGPQFLPAHATSYARVSWQVGYAKGVPRTAQGVGLVIMRDFARWLAGRSPGTAVRGEAPPAYAKLILGGISQSAWFVDTFIAEGFNVDPVGGGRVFDAAVAIDGVGGWMAINRMAAEHHVVEQFPYLTPDGFPLTREQLLSRPATDPLYVDVANYTDFYRLRASMTSTTYSSPRFRRYDWPSPHAAGGSVDAVCNEGRPVVYNTLSYSPYMRTLVLGVERQIGVEAAASAAPLPPSTVFALGPAPAPSLTFNALPGAELRVPRLDAEGWPVGGVRFPEADEPVGRPSPAAVSPVVTTSMDVTCGNHGGWVAWDRATLARLYGSDPAYAKRYAASVAALVRQGFLSPAEQAALRPAPILP